MGEGLNRLAFALPDAVAATRRNYVQHMSALSLPVDVSTPTRCAQHGRQAQRTFVSFMLADGHRCSTVWKFGQTLPQADRGLLHLRRQLLCRVGA